MAGLRGPNQVRTNWHLSVVLCVFSVLLGGCHPNSSTSDAAAPPAKTYQVRGVVRQISQQGDRTQLLIRHAAIPDFVDIHGGVVGMDPMTMHFAVADQVELSGLEVGLEISFQLLVDWNAAEPASITALEILPDQSEKN